MEVEVKVMVMVGGEWMWFEDDTDIRHGLPLLPSASWGGEEEEVACV